MTINQADNTPERATPPSLAQAAACPDTDQGSGVKGLPDPVTLPASLSCRLPGHRPRLGCRVAPRSNDPPRLHSRHCLHQQSSKVHLRSGLNLTSSRTSHVCRNECHLHLACLLSARTESLHSLLRPARRILRLGPGASDGKESACSVGDSGWIPGSGRFPVAGTGYPLQYSCLENSMDISLYLPKSDGTGCHDVCFLNVEF